MDHVEEHAGELIALYQAAGKPLIINISGKDVDDTIDLLKRALQCRFPVVVVNGACPNKRERPILCHDPEGVGELFSRAEDEIQESHSLILWKVSNGMPRSLLAQNCDLVARSWHFEGIINGNTFPNCLDYLPDGKTAIETANGFNRGGMSGPAILPIALDQVEFCAKRLPPSKVVVGCGGITTPQDAMKFFRAGARLVQFNTVFREAAEDPQFVTSFLHDLYELMENEAG
jgi:dihydroorotate dehydrogenase